MSDGNLPMPSGVSGRVVNVSLTTRGQDATGQWVNGKNVTYQLSNGLAGVVFIPDSVFTPETVKAYVMADAANLHASANVTF